MSWDEIPFLRWQQIVVYAVFGYFKNTQHLPGTAFCSSNFQICDRFRPILQQTSSIISGNYAFDSTGSDEPLIAPGTSTLPAASARFRLTTQVMGKALNRMTNDQYGM